MISARVPSHFNWPVPNFIHGGQEMWKTAYTLMQIIIDLADFQQNQASSIILLMNPYSEPCKNLVKGSVVDNVS